jgi:hypothetical protein
VYRLEKSVRVSACLRIKDLFEDLFLRDQVFFLPGRRMKIGFYVKEARPTNQQKEKQDEPATSIQL